MADFDLVLKGWPAESELNALGGDVLNCLFKDHPGSLELFPKFAGIATGDLVGHTAVAAHGETVLKKLTEIIKTKGGHTTLLKSLANTHATMHKIPVSSFKLLSEAIIKVMGEKGKLDGAGQEALRRVMAVVINDVDGFYKEFGFAG